MSNIGRNFRQEIALVKRTQIHDLMFHFEQPEKEQIKSKIE